MDHPADTDHEASSGIIAGVASNYEFDARVEQSCSQSHWIVPMFLNDMTRDSDANVLLGRAWYVRVRTLRANPPPVLTQKHEQVIV